MNGVTGEKTLHNKLWKAHLRDTNYDMCGQQSDLSQVKVWAQQKQSVITGYRY